MGDDGRVLRYLWIFWLIASAGLLWSITRGGVSPAHVMLGIGLLFVAYWLSPLYGGISRKHRDVESLPEDERRFVVYWRPGDIFSQRLRGGLGKHRKQAIWINTWQDRDAERHAKELGDGMLPVVVLDGETYVNPDPRDIIAKL